MTKAENSSHIFLSYAWGAEFEKKEWVRQGVVASLAWKYNVFWDRDTLALGELIGQTISRALAKRPLIVLCLCDHDYLKAAQTAGSGLYEELRMLTKIADKPGVRIIPLILESGSAKDLPSPLKGRLYLNLQPLHSRSLDIGMAALGVASGLSQAQLQSEINDGVAVFDLRQRAIRFFNCRPITIWGSGKNHEVMVHLDSAGRFLLKPPQWMWESSMWRYFLEEDTPISSPAKGRWHWEYIDISSEMHPLGTAVASSFFPHLVGKSEQKFLSTIGKLLAHKFFRLIRINEAFTFDANDLVNHLVGEDEGFNALKELLDVAEAPVEKSRS